MKFKEDIEEYGWSVIIIEATKYLPSFAYTVGLWEKYKHPELISFGLTNKTLHTILNEAGNIIKLGQVIDVNLEYDNFFESSPTKFIKVDTRNIADYFGYAIEYYNTNEFPALQLIWTDRNNQFPWDANFEVEFKFKQPLLDRNADFKYREEKNLGIFTTRQWLVLKKPILKVIHDGEGDWQFLTGDQLFEDIRLVALEQMTLRDHTLNEVFNLDYGESAEREFVGGKWLRKTYQEEVN